MKISVYFKNIDIPYVISGTKKIIEGAWININKVMKSGDLLLFEEQCTIRGSEIRMIRKHKQCMVE